LGGLFLMLALLAQQIGLAHDQRWGASRVLVLAAGLFLCTLASVVYFWGRFKWLGPVLLPVGHSEEGEKTAPAWMGALYTGLGVMIVALAAVWYLTGGTFTRWVPYSAYYNRQAQAFKAGQLALLEKPPAELLALANPYDYRQREGIAYLWDASLYQGQYYLYWGPVPALLAWPVLAFHPEGVEDQVLLLGFLVVMAVSLGLLLWDTWRRFFASAPPWTLLVLILAGGLGLPVFWLVNRPNVYETAIAGGQAFLLLGLWGYLRASFSRQHVGAWSVLAGAAWGLAIGCRINLLLAVAFFAGLTLWQLVRSKKLWQSRVLNFLPLLAVLLGLGAYNFTRFGSVLETGHRYQLTGPALPANYNRVMSLEYILPSLYSYTLRPLEFNRDEFPFVFTPYIKESNWPFFIRLPKDYYYPEPVAGLLWAVPVVWLVFLPLLAGIWRLWRWLDGQNFAWREALNFDASSQQGWWWSLAGGACLIFASILIFISNSMRYQADVLPLLVLLSALGLWWGLKITRAFPFWRRCLLVLCLALGVLTVSFSLLANFQNGDRRFEAINPKLYSALARQLESWIK
jgi:hypothetical protein